MNETCIKKATLTSKREAKRCARRNLKNNLKLVPYHCPYCGYYHLTKLKSVGYKIKARANKCKIIY